MPFLLPALPAIAGGVAAAGAGALINKAVNGGGGGGGNAAITSDPLAPKKSQEQVYSQTEQLQSFLDALKNNNAIQNQNILGGQLLDQTMGRGPNPAAAQLANTTGQNIAQQASLMASQRGVGANPGLAARNIAQQGSAIQQQAGGQAAVLRANQQLAAQQALQQLAAQQLAQQANATNAVSQAGLQNQGQILGAAGQQANIQGAMDRQNAGFNQQLIGGALSGAGSAIGSGIQNMLNKNNTTVVPAGAHGGQIEAPGFFGAAHKFGAPMQSGGVVPGNAKVAGDSTKNDNILALLSPKEIVLPRSVTLSKDAPEKAAKFVAMVLGRNGLRG